MKWLKISLLIAVIAFAGASYYLFQFSNTALNAQAINQKVEFDLLKGTRPREVSVALQNQGIVKDGWAFYWLGKFTQSWVGIKAADYELSPSMTPMQIFKLFRSGIGIQRALLVHEGDNIYQVAQSFEETELMDKQSAVKLLRSPELIASLGLRNEGLRTLEGYLYPNTYFYDRKEASANLIKRMVDAFLRTWTADFEARAKELGMTRKQVVILASMVEKETGAGFERPIIASVFYNRLRKKMKLQSDPTTIYGMWSEYTGNIHRSDLVRPTEYNTYTVPALPIGPISNPNPESIKAVLYPADTDYLYFVSKNDGTHFFSRTYGEHNDRVKKTQLDPHAKEGKSWRNYKDKKSAVDTGIAH
ncbi:MAG: endolytic transglycosylase MltG [Bdellovibrionales bacterium]|nr:endolytic transglycosylase MltG [Oligoflexia bacterium]